MYEKLEQELTQAGSMEEIQEILKNNGVEMSIADIQNLAQEQIPEGELSEDDLDAVAGGASLVKRILDLIRRIHGPITPLPFPVRRK